MTPIGMWKQFSIENVYLSNCKHIGDEVKFSSDKVTEIWSGTKGTVQKSFAGISD
jgi:hypothetical protein